MVWSPNSKGLRMFQNHRNMDIAKDGQYDWVGDMVPYFLTKLYVGYLGCLVYIGADTELLLDKLYHLQLF